MEGEQYTTNHHFSILWNRKRKENKIHPTITLLFFGMESGRRTIYNQPSLLYSSVWKVEGEQYTTNHHFSILRYRERNNNIQPTITSLFFDIENVRGTIYIQPSLLYSSVWKVEGEQYTTNHHFSILRYGKFKENNIQPTIAFISIKSSFRNPLKFADFEIKHLKKCIRVQQSKIKYFFYTNLYNFILGYKNLDPIDRWMKGCILPFPKKGDLGLAKNYRGITLTSIAAKIYNALIRNRIEPKIDNMLRKNHNGYRRNRSTTSQILTIRRILEGVRAKNIQATLLFVDFTKTFDSIHRGKMEQILLAYGLPKETVEAIKILYRNTKVKVRSPDGDTEYFDIVAGVLQGDTQAPYLFIICLDYVLRTSIDKIRENGFELTKK